MVGLVRHSQRKRGANGQALPTAYGARARLYQHLKTGGTMKQFLVLVVATTCATGALQAQDLRSLPVEGAVLQYEVAGTGPAVVLLHGWAHSLESWHYLFPDLAETYTTLRFDRRGFARSSGMPDTSLDPLDVQVLLDSLGIEKTVVVGHSQGANSALRFALEFPERLSGLILLGSGPPSGLGVPWNGPDRLPRGHAQIAREEGMAAWLALWNGHPINNGFVDGTE